MRSLTVFCAVILVVATVSSAQTRSSGSSSQVKPAAPAVTLPPEPGLYAVIFTSMGNIICRLFDKDDPKTVANFRALATGAKPWTDPATGKTRHTPLYTNTTFHRVIPGFMIQGGDPSGTGEGTPGYEFEDEIDGTHNFDKPGILAMANSGPNTNGCQFFITVAPASHLNGNYSIFGEVVSGQDVANAIAEVPRDSKDKPLTPVKILRISIQEVQAPAPKTAAIQ